MLSRLVRGCIALAFTACVLAVACSNCHADSLKGGELSCMTLPLQREPTAYRSLLVVAEAVLANPEPMLSRLVRSCIALAFTASVPADACSHCHVDAVKGGKLSYMGLALQRDPTAGRSLLMVAEAVLADPQPMLTRVVRSCIALAFTACVPADACIHRHVDSVKGGELSCMGLAMQRDPAAGRLLLMVAEAVLAAHQNLVCDTFRIRYVTPFEYGT